MPPVTEQTPLIQTVIVTPRQPRYSHSYIRRFCSAALGVTLVVILVLFLIPGRYLPGNRSEQEWAPLPWSSSYPQGSWPATTGLKFDELQKILLEAPSEEKAREWSQHYSSGPHLAGKNLSLAEWTQDKWEEFGVKSKIVPYEVYINYPISHRLALLESSESSGREHELSPSDSTVKHECSLEEDVLKEDPTTGLDDRVPTFHGYSANGNITAQYVYVNFGTFYDYQDLIDAGVELEGKIALAKYGHVFRGLKVKRAEELGMKGVVIYSDPQEDGNMTEVNGHKSYPDGPARNPSSVQRGSVQYINILPGDPTTPGYPSLPGVPRTDPHYSTTKIPSLPISYTDALPLLRALNGHGPKASDFNKYWQGGGLAHKGVKYNIGPSPPNLTLNLRNEQEYVVTPIWDVIGIINGTISDEVVVLGNHRDAWIAGGAVDPHSGSAALNEVVRSFGIALEKGWKPLRTLVFASWDGEEYGLIGSTEWVEEHIPWLSKSAITYLNVDTGTYGTYFKASASPILNKALREVTSIVPSPNQTVKGQSVSDLWDGTITTLGSGSDYTAFLDHAGIASFDFKFVRENDEPVYHYHSNYDSFTWVDKFGDPKWLYTTTAAKILSLLAVHIAETPLIGFNATDYAVELRKYVDSLPDPPSYISSDENNNISLQALKPPLHTFHSRAVSLDARATHLSSQLQAGIPWWKWWTKVRLYRDVQAVNHRYIQLERQFLYAGGLDSRPWFKHTVFAPGIWTGYAGATLPGLREALDDAAAAEAVAARGTKDAEGNGKEAKERVEKWIGIVKERIDAASELLKL